MPVRLRRLLSSTSIVAVCVVAVVVLLVAPGWLAGRSAGGGPGQPRPSAPTGPADAIGSRNWTAVECPRHAVGCPVPTVLNLGGARFLHRSTHRQQVRQREPDTRSINLDVSPAGGRRWLLVGAQDASSASQLSITLGDREPAPLPPGTLTFLSVPGKHRRVEVTVADFGRPGGREVLHLEEYDALLGGP